MTEDIAQLNEVVVVGYGSLSKKEISSSVVQIKQGSVQSRSCQRPDGTVSR